MKIQFKTLLTLTLFITTIVSASTVTGVLSVKKYNDRGHYDPVLGLVVESGEFVVVNDSDKGSDLIEVKGNLDKMEITVQGELSQDNKNITVEQFAIAGVSTADISQWKFDMELEDGE